LIKRIMLLLTVAFVMVALLAPMAMAQAQEDPPATPPRDQDQSGTYGCDGPTVVDENGSHYPVYTPLSKKEAEEGLASGAYVRCQKNLPYQASEPGVN
jgi:hypothetical protein